MTFFSEIFWETVAAFIGTVAFSVLFIVPKRQWLLCGLVGSAGWIVYALAEFWFSGTVASFFSTVVIVLLARVLAVVRRVPTNVLMIPGIFPIVPGIGIYNTIYNLLIGDGAVGLEKGLGVLKAIGAIVLGIIVVFSLPNRWFKQAPKMRSRMRMEEVAAHRKQKLIE